MSAKKQKRTPATSPADVPRDLAVPIAVAVSALAPFVQPLGPAVGPYAMRFSGILIAACVWAWAWALAPEQFRSGRRLLLASAAVAASVLVAALASHSPGNQLTFGAEGGLMAAPSWIALLAVFVSASAVKPSPRVVGALRLAFVWAAISAAMVLAERLFGRQVTGGFGNANYAGAALVALVPLALFYANTETDARFRPWWRYLTFGLIAAVIATGSLANMIALVVATIGMCLVAPEILLGIESQAARRAARALTLGSIVVLVVLTLSLTTSVLPGPVDEFVSERILGNTVQTRLEMWNMAARMIADSPLLGVGPDGVQLESQRYMTERLLELESGGFSDYRVLMKDPHSLPLRVPASLGVLGFAALLWLAFEWLRTLRRTRAEADPASRSWALRGALAVGVLAHLAALLFMPWAVSFGPLIPLLAGLAIAGGVGDEEGVLRPLPAAVRPAVAVIATLLTVWLAGAAAYGDSRIAVAKDQSSPELAREAYAAGARVQPTRPYLAYEALYASGFLASESLESLPAYQDAVDAAPRDVLANAGFLANLVQPSLDEAYLTGRTDLAWERERIDRAVALAPNHPDVVLEQAHLALLSGDLERAEVLLARTERLAPNAPRHLLYRYYLALATGDEATAEELLPRIEATGPGHNRLAKGWNR